MDEIGDGRAHVLPYAGRAVRPHVPLYAGRAVRPQVGVGRAGEPGGGTTKCPGRLTDKVKIMQDGGHGAPFSRHGPTGQG
ncbi:hypothetical protein [Streptomyces sp. SID161]|uniref:hypothetical protein n=1 Tax=Streptomyces sp. SID161 TaxID=2690251 RepID=UPI00136CB51B|nr:hypothetical protein [Streptomyces sp. SID161]MYW43847.1 hypothetical protein [Streptomyces sp. SID161]